MIDFKQVQRFIKLAGPSSVGTLLPVEFRGQEALSEPFRYELEFMAARQQPLPFDQLMGQAITVEVKQAGGSWRCFHGIVERLAEGEQDAEFRLFQAVLVPEWSRRSRNARCRIFQQRTVPEILKTVLAGLKVQFRLHGRYQPRNYCVQFRESDFNFASRLMEEEGIFYFFEHSLQGHELIVADYSLDGAEVREASTIAFERVQPPSRDRFRLTFWRKAQVMTASKVTLSDYCFELPDQQLEASMALVDKVQVGQVNHNLRGDWNAQTEVVDFPGFYAHHYDGSDPGGREQPETLRQIFEDNKFRARLHAERAAVQSLEIDGQGNCGHFLPGHRFTLAGHGDGDGGYLLQRVQFHARVSGYRSGREGDLDFDYSNKFSCLPRDLPYRPPLRTPRPSIPGVQTAVVVGIEGEEVFTDKFGRVKVQFHWDRDGKRGADSSCWIRVGHSHAGAGFGAMSIPRVGQEVLVAFRMGDPDVPFIVASLYNAACMPPFELPKQRTVSGLKTHTHGGNGEAFNGIAFNDARGQESLQLHAQKDLNVNAEDNQVVNVGGNSHVNIGGNEVCNVSGNDDVTVSGIRNVNVGGMYNVTVGGVNFGPNGNEFVKSAPWNFSVDGKMAAAVGIKTERVLGGNFVVTGGIYDRVTVGLDSRVTLFGDLHVVTGFSADTVLGKRVVVTAGPSSQLTTGDHSVTCGGALATQSNAAITFTAQTDFAVNTKRSASILAPGFMNLCSRVVSLTSHMERDQEGVQFGEISINHDGGYASLKFGNAESHSDVQVFADMIFVGAGTSSISIGKKREGGVPKEYVTIKVGGSELTIKNDSISLSTPTGSMTIGAQGVEIKGVKVEIDSDTETLIKGLTQKYQSLSEAMGGN